MVSKILNYTNSSRGDLYQIWKIDITEKIARDRTEGSKKEFLSGMFYFIKVHILYGNTSLMPDRYASLQACQENGSEHQLDKLAHNT